MSQFVSDMRSLVAQIEPLWTIILVPIWQEFLFRYLPYRFLFLPSGKFWVIGIITSLIFASIPSINSALPNPVTLRKRILQLQPFSAARSSVSVWIWKQTLGFFLIISIFFPSGAEWKKSRLFLTNKSYKNCSTKNTTMQASLVDSVVLRQYN